MKTTEAMCQLYTKFFEYLGEKLRGSSTTPNTIIYNSEESLLLLCGNSQLFS